MKTTQIKIEGMSCDGCVASAQRALADVPGVRNATVNLASGVATVEGDETLIDDALVVAAEDAGYDAQVVTAS